MRWTLGQCRRIPYNKLGIFGVDSPSRWVLRCRHGNSTDRPRPVNQSEPNRCTALLLALLFLLSMAGDAFGSHECAHHNPAPPSQSSGNQPEHATEAGHHAHDSADLPTPAPHDTGHGEPCTCIGMCQAGSAAALPPSPRVELRDPVAIAAAPSITEAAPDLPRFRPFFLPYPTAPTSSGLNARLAPNRSHPFSVPARPH